MNKLLYEHEKEHFAISNEELTTNDVGFKELHYYPPDLRYFINIEDGDIVVDKFYDMDDRPVHLHEENENIDSSINCADRIGYRWT